MLRGFEQNNQVTIQMTWELVNAPAGRVLAAVAVATNDHADPVVRARWDSARAVLPAREYKSLMGLATSLLYRLDFEIGEAEMHAIGINRA